MRSSRCRFFEPEAESVFYCGLDLGQSKEYTALCAIERRPETPALYHVRSLKRFQLGTSYPDIVKKVQVALQSPAIDPNLLLIDNTGVGIAVTDLFRKTGLNFCPITITGGEKVTSDARGIRVPKRDLASTLQVLFQTKRLKIAGNLPDAQILIDRVKTASYGYAGFFDAVRIKEEQLDALHRFDVALAARVVDVENAVQKVSDAIDGQGEIAQAIQDLTNLLTNLNNLYNRRSEAIVSPDLLTDSGYAPEVDPQLLEIGE